MYVAWGGWSGSKGFNGVKARNGDGNDRDHTKSKQPLDEWLSCEPSLGGFHVSTLGDPSKDFPCSQVRKF